MHRLLPNDFHVVERTQEEQQPQQGPYDGEEGEIGQYQARQGQGQMIRQGQNGHGQQQRRIARRSLPSSHLTQYALRNCCRVFDAMEKSLGSNELLMDSMLHYMHYRNRRMNNVRSISVGKLYTMFKDGIVNWTNKYNTDGLKIIGEDILVHYTYPEVVAEEGGAVEGPDGSEYVKRKLYKAVRTTERNINILLPIMETIHGEWYDNYWWRQTKELIVFTVDMTDFIPNLTDVFVNITRNDVQIRVKRGDEMITVIDSQWYDEIKSGVCILQGKDRIKIYLTKEFAEYWSKCLMSDTKTHKVIQYKNHVCDGPCIPENIPPMEKLASNCVADYDSGNSMNCDDDSYLSMEFEDVSENFESKEDSESDEDEYMESEEEDEYLESEGDSGHSEPESEMLENFENSEDDEDL